MVGLMCRRVHVTFIGLMTVVVLVILSFSGVQTALLEGTLLTSEASIVAAIFYYF